MTKFLSFLGRILLAQIFLVAVLIQLYMITQHPSGYESYQMYLAQFGLVPFFAPLTILIQLVFGLMLLLGYKTRLAAYILAIYAIFVAIVLKLQIGDLIGFMQYLAIAGGYITLAVHAPTAWSLDNLRKKS
ncbi:putative oxidoreductase [Methylobacillus rhizosphaerae]|uniref:Putative oxidoreductase n=1 Tax=Methylobacillus rhizosphaerae TaxID=551994 RepID=A0A238XU67_9PROT|nr:DoxX family protein [Methylobacillus rhizosphaerae]SNR61983.1 putative oxidoreductase [Methylobacillus rhizosphaerae]